MVSSDADILDIYGVDVLSMIEILKNEVRYEAEVEYAREAPLPSLTTFGRQCINLSRGL
jgi:hypothetical protein